MVAPIALLVFSAVGAARSASALKPSRAWAPAFIETDQEFLPVELLEHETHVWQGLDVEDHSQLLQAPSANTVQPEANVEVLGLQDTGTNLLVSMLLLNFGQRLRYYDWSNPKNATGNFRNGLWKHSNLRTKYEAEPQDVEVLGRQNVTGVIMVREPLSWLQSMRKAPYELGYCVMWSDTSESKWLVRKCKHPHPAGFQSIVNKTVYTNMEEIWNNWTRADYYAEQYGWKSHMIIRYEDLIRNPFGELDRIAAHLGMAHPAPWLMRSTSAKSHGDSLGRRAALQKLRYKTYLDEYFPNQTTTACRLLDAEMMTAYNYLDCEHILKGWGPARHLESQGTEEEAEVISIPEGAVVANVPTLVEQKVGTANKALHELEVGKARRASRRGHTGKRRHPRRRPLLRQKGRERRAQHGRRHHRGGPKVRPAV